MAVARPAVPTAKNVRNSALLRLWYEYALDLEKRLAPAEPPPPVVEPPPASVPGLVLIDGKVYFEDGVTPAGFTEGVKILYSPSAVSGHTWWRQVNIHDDAWDWIVPAGATFRAGVWTPVAAVPGPLPAPDEPPPMPTQPPATERAYMDHWMLAFSGVGKGMEPEKDTIARGEKYGLNVRGLFADGPLKGTPEDNGYGQRMLAMLDAMKGTNVRGMAWCHLNGHPKEEFLEFAQISLTHECVWRPKGRPVLAWYSYYDYQVPIVAYMRANLGFEFDLYAMPYVWDDNQWLTEHGQAGGRQRVYTDLGSWYLPLHPELQGIINFAVDFGVGYNDPEALVRAKVRNTNIAEGCRAHGRVSVLGWNARYYTDTFSDDAIRAQLAHMESLNADHWCVTTGNDLVEKSYVDDVGVDFATENGERVVYLPPRGTFRFGDNVPYPSKVQTRFSDLALPYVKRFRGLA